MELLMNPEVMCLLAILFVILTIASSGFLSMLWGCCAIGSIGVIWWHIIVDDSDEDF